MWVRTSIPTGGKRLRRALSSGRSPLLFFSFFVLLLALLTLYYTLGGSIPGAPPEATLAELLRSAWYVPVGAAAAVALVVQLVVLLIATAAARRSQALRLCPQCGRVYPRSKSRCDRCGKPLARAEEFSWKKPVTPVPEKSDFTGESPFD